MAKTLVKFNKSCSPYGTAREVKNLDKATLKALDDKIKNYKLKDVYEVVETKKKKSKKSETKTEE